MPSTIFISIETDGGPRRDAHTIQVPDLAPDMGEGSTVPAKRAAVAAAAAAAATLDGGEIMQA